MTNYIDIGIDFGAENIVIIANGYDNKGRPDYKLVNLEPAGSVKNYIGKKKENSEIVIGTDVKISYICNPDDNEYEWIGGRYKAFISEEERPEFAQTPEHLLKYGLEKIIDKLETFDFLPLLSGELRNLTVGVPQSWGFNKKLLYHNILNYWQHGSVNLLAEPLAATIAAYKRSTTSIGKNIIMILDIGASTFDISFAKLRESDQKLDVYKTNYRSEFAGHYFDIVFAAFALQEDLNRTATVKLVDRPTLLRLKSTNDYVTYLQKYHEKFSSLLLDLETIKENHLFEIAKFNRKKLIDSGTSVPIIINKQIYQKALDYYINQLATEINMVISQFKFNEEISTDEKIFPFLCGGGSSLQDLEKKIRERMSVEERTNLFSLSKESYGSKIDTTIAIGLAYYAQNPEIINKRLEYSLGVSLPEEEGKHKEYWIFNEGDTYPLTNDKCFSELLGEEQELQYHGEADGNIGFPIIQKSSGDEHQIHKDIINISMQGCEKEDNFDLFFNIDNDGIITVTVKNLSKDMIIKQNLQLYNFDEQN